MRGLRAIIRGSGGKGPVEGWGCGGGTGAWRRALANARRLAIRHALPLGFALGVTWALVWPRAGQAAAAVVVGRSAANPKGTRLFDIINNWIIFCISGLTLRTDEFRHLARLWAAPAYGMLAILLLTPLSALGAKALPLTPREFAEGIAVYACVPTTLGAGVALTQIAHGNQALAVLLTVATNSLAVVTMPYLLHLLLSGTEVRMDPATLSIKLATTVLAPTLLGMTLRASHPRVKRWVARHKTGLSLLSVFNLVMLLWQILSGARDVLLAQSGTALALAAGAVIAQHLIFLAVNWAVAAWALRFPPAETVAVVLMGSQKSGAVAVTVISFITKDAAEQGLLSIPCIIGQVSQIFIGSFIAARLAVWVDRANAAAAATDATVQDEGEQEEEEQEEEEEEEEAAGGGASVSIDVGNEKVLASAAGGEEGWACVDKEGEAEGEESEAVVVEGIL